MSNFQQTYLWIYSPLWRRRGKGVWPPKMQAHRSWLQDGHALSPLYLRNLSRDISGEEVRVPGTIVQDKSGNGAVHCLLYQGVISPAHVTNKGFADWAAIRTMDNTGAGLSAETFPSSSRVLISHKQMQPAWSPVTNKVSSYKAILRTSCLHSRWDQSVSM